MASRTSSRDRIHWLEAFVLAWDDFVATSQKANTMDPLDAAHAHAALAVKVKQQEVVRARNRVGVISRD